jgi:hypothetical protein
MAGGSDWLKGETKYDDVESASPKGFMSLGHHQRGRFKVGGKRLFRTGVRHIEPTGGKNVSQMGPL